MTPHLFHDSTYRTYDKSRRICRCGQIETHRVHEVPPVPEEAREIDQRRLGERV